MSDHITSHDALEHVLHQAMAESGAVGAQVTLTVAGRTTSVAAGLRSVTTGEPMTTDTALQVGSFAKVLTAILVHQLVDDGLADLDVPVRVYLPELKLGDDETARSVTLRHLLSMSSGLDFGFYGDSGLNPDAVERHVASLSGSTALFPPGERFAYSGEGIVVAGRVVEVLRGCSWDDAVQRQVVEPAGLRRTSTDPLTFPLGPFSPGHTVPRDGVAAVVPTLDHLRGTGPNGTTLVSTADDLARLAGALLHADAGAVLSPAATARMHEPTTPLSASMVADHWCLGPYVRHLPDGSPVYGHGGRWTAGVCDVVWAPGADIVLATVTNTPDRAGSLVLATWDRLLPDLLGDESWTRPRAGDDVAGDLTRYPGLYRSPSAEYAVFADGAGLRIEARRRWSAAEPYPSEPAVRHVLPIGLDRFLPVQSDAVEQPLQETWFSPEGTEAEFFYDGLLGARRVRA